MPGIFIGIGGIGGSIVADVRQELELRVALAGDSPSAHAAASQFQFLLIDTWKDGAALGFEASQCFDLPDGKDKFDVDAKIDSWYHGGDPAFPRWWPERKGVPLKAGAYAAGAGQLRIKGKLAYRISLTGQGTQVVPAVHNALNQIDSIHGPASGIHTVPVYLVCSLGGGTGSGMVLTFAQHLRQSLPAYCSLIGVFPLAGITELGPGAADTVSIWANTDAALREIDYCQRVAGTPENGLTPFFQWPGEGNVLYGTERPFEYVYLFGRHNQNGLALGEFSQYVRMIAETLVAESFSSLIDEGLQTGIKGPHSQFIMQLQAKREVAGRPTTYASAAVGSLIYPAERIERHLARRYAVAVLDRMSQSTATEARAAADSFIKENALLWSGVPRLEDELTKPVVSAEGRESVLTSMPQKLNPERDPDYAKVNRDKTLAAVDAARMELDAYASKTYLTHLKQRRASMLAAYASSNGGLRAFVQDSLATRGPNALGQTLEIVRLIRIALHEQWQEINTLIEGSPDPAAQKEGMKKALARRHEQWDADRTKLGKGFGTGFLKIGSGNGKKAKERFFRQTWRPLESETLHFERLVVGRELYSSLEAETKQVEAALGQLLTQIGALRAELEAATSADVGKHGKVGVLDLPVLDDPRLVAHAFGEMLDQVVQQGVDECAQAVTARVESERQDNQADDLDEVEALEIRDERLSQTGIVSATLEQRLGGKAGNMGLLNDTFRGRLQEAIVADGVQRIGPDVRRLSVWDALAAECRARIDLNMQDLAVTHALTTVRLAQGHAEKAGAPPKDWARELLKAFIRERMFECQKRVRPFWNLDGLMTANHDQPYHFIVIAADESAYREAESTLGIGGVLDSTAQQLKAGTPKWLPGKDRVVLYAREGVAPLFYLNKGELKRLRDAAAQKSHEKVLYTDKRFERVADPIIRPAESAEDLLQYTVAIGLQLGVIDRSAVDGHLNGRLAMRVNGEEAEFASVRDLADALAQNAAVHREIVEKVNHEMRRIRAEERDGELQQALARVQDLRGAADHADRPAESRWWKSAERALQSRLAYGQYFVN
jgi:hypothetical protein